MADFSFTPAATGIKPVPQTSLADMIGVARGAQSYQQSLQVNPLEVQKAQAELERSQIATRVARGTETPTITSAEQAAKTATAGTGSAELKLAKERVDGIVSRLTGLINNPLVIAAERDPIVAEANKEQLNRIVSEYGRQQAKELGIPTEIAESAIAPYLTTAAQSPSGFRQFLKEKLLSTVDSSSRIQALQPTGTAVTTGAGGGTVSTSEFGSTPQGTVLPGTSFTTQLAPGQTYVATEGDGTGLPAGTPYVAGAAKPTPTGQPSGTTFGGQPSAPSARPRQLPTGPTPTVVQAAPMVIPPGETATTADAAKQIQLSSNAAAKGVAQSTFNNNQILGLADNALAGLGAQTAANLGGGFALIPWTSDATSNRQKLGDFLARETLTLASAGGLGTDAGRELQTKLTGTTNWTPEAIKSTARLNRSLSLGVNLFNEGVNNAVADKNNKYGVNNPFAARDYQNRWSQIADVNAFRLMDLMKNNDTVGMASLVKELGGPNDNRLKLLKLKVQTLDKMIQGAQ